MENGGTPLAWPSGQVIVKWFYNKGLGALKIGFWVGHVALFSGKESPLGRILPTINRIT
jgi:hypothetical protein